MAGETLPEHGTFGDDALFADVGVKALPCPPEKSMSFGVFRLRDPAERMEAEDSDGGRLTDEECCGGWKVLPAVEVDGGEVSKNEADETVLLPRFAPYKASDTLDAVVPALLTPLLLPTLPGLQELKGACRKRSKSDAYTY